MNRMIVRFLTLIVAAAVAASSMPAAATTAPVLQRVPTEAGPLYLPSGYEYLADPLADPDVQDLVAAGYFTPEELGYGNYDPLNPITPDVVVPVAAPVIIKIVETIIVVGIGVMTTIGIMQAAPEPSNPAEPQKKDRWRIIKFVPKILTPIGGTWVACELDYINNWETTNNRRCYQAVYNATHSEPMARAVDEHFGRTADTFLLNMRRAANVQLQQGVFETSLGSNVVTYYPAGNLDALIRGGVRQQLDVSVQVLPPGRIVLPVRAFEVGGAFQVDWAPKNGTPQTVTLTRISDGRTVTYTIGSTRAEVSDGTVLDLDLAPQIMPPGRTMLPFRAAFTPFCMIDWYPKIQRAAALCKV